MKIVYFSPIAFSDMKQRPQYFAEMLSRNHQVYYIEPTKRILSYFKYKEFGSEEYKVNKNLTVFRCDGKAVLPFRWNVYDPLYLNGIYEFIQLKKMLRNADIIIVGFEGWYNVINRVKNKKIIYDKMDDNSLLSNVEGNRVYLQKCEKELIEKSTAMIASAKAFVKRYEKELPVYLISNAFDKNDGQYIYYKHQTAEQKVYGYVGVIAEWFDNRAIELIAENPNNQVVLVGPCRNEKIEKENVVYIGRVEKSEVAKYISSFDVCLYPFKKSQLLDTINPVKIYEYLLFNKPVIAVESEETKSLGANIYIYDNYNELKNLCNQRLSHPFDSEFEYNLFIEQNSWESRIEKINEILEELK